MKLGIKILLRHGVKDSQGAAVANALETMGFEGVEDVQIGKYIVVSMKEDTVESRKTIENMCDKLLANMVIERYFIEWPEKGEIWV
jgi:phosphoribosylformylglycinamidine synthase PurS subunit|tara:strand:+ start:331 stop:588 length:258 start_codon:yes stop_codon:yes gene_type:complete